MTPVELATMSLVHDRREVWRVMQTGLVVAGAFAGKMPELTLSPFRKNPEEKVDDDALGQALLAWAQGHNAARRKATAPKKTVSKRKAS